MRPASGHGGGGSGELRRRAGSGGTRAIQANRGEARAACPFRSKSNSLHGDPEAGRVAPDAASDTASGAAAKISGAAAKISGAKKFAPNGGTGKLRLCT